MQEEQVKRGNKKESVCYHCGEDCARDLFISADHKNFCCEGCRLVYELLSKNELCEYYDLEKNPGLSQKLSVRPGKFDYLDHDEIKNKLFDFRSEDYSIITFYLPQIHCNSCIWLLEHLGKLDQFIISSRVNFLKKEVTVNFNEKKGTLKQVAELLTRVGYEPYISLRDVQEKKVNNIQRKDLYKIGIAGFCFGNIMMMSFPEYFSSGHLGERGLKELFAYLNFILSIPVMFYCGSVFFTSAYSGLKQKTLNIDAPIALALIITFGRSVYEIATATGSGYFDSLTGIVFFMLLGRFFQKRTYQSIAFDRDYTAYFPVSVSILENGEERQVPLAELKSGQRIKVYNNEIIPADAILFRGEALIDYSFVSGEQIPVKRSLGEIIYAGGKQTNGAIELELIKEVSQSYLTQLWNRGTVNDKKDLSFIHSLSRYFTYVLFTIAIAAATYWYVNDADKTWKALTAVLIVACPCALLLSATFTNGNILRMFQRGGIYFKNEEAVEKLTKIDTIVFDKTGTITKNGSFQVSFHGNELSGNQRSMIKSLVSQSSHPLSRAIKEFLDQDESIEVKNFKEKHGEGIQGMINGVLLKTGSLYFVSDIKLPDGLAETGKVYVSVNNAVTGYFNIKAMYREGLEKWLTDLQKKYEVYILSGDNDAEKTYLNSLIRKEERILFNQSPHDKLNFIKKLQHNGKQVMMLGDGLNDAGALMQSNVGVAVSENVNNFSPACDAILEGKHLCKTDRFIKYSTQGKKIIYGSFVLSVIYNIIGLYYATTASLEPMIAAILMPLSAVSIVLFTTGCSAVLGRDMIEESVNKG